jgi:hypothetical protein
VLCFDMLSATYNDHLLIIKCLLAGLNFLARHSPQYKEYLTRDYEVSSQSSL